MSENIYEALRASHEIQRGLLRRMLRAKPSDGARQALFGELRVELAAHEAAEERFLYVPMLMDDMGLSASRHALHEHHEIDELIEDIVDLDPSGDAWLDTAKALSKKIHHHLREEEKKFFQVSGKILSGREKRALAAQYKKDYERMKRARMTTP